MSQVGQNSVSEFQPNFNFKILTKLFAQKSEQTFSFLTKPRLPNLQQIVTSYNINKFWVGIFTREGHINKVY